MDKNNVKNFLAQTEKVIKKLREKAGALAKAVEKDATYGTKAGMLKIEQLSLENEKNKLIAQFGKKAYSLFKTKKLMHKSLSEHIDKISVVENNIKIKKSELSKLKNKRKKK